MGGYGGFVWPAYLLSAATIAGLAFLIGRRAARLRRRLEQLQKPEDAADV